MSNYALCLDFNLIDQFLQRMPAKYQAVLKLKYEQGYTLAKNFITIKYR